uniref:Uncharacterized protein n=1 Tax=Anguilla anguilla TaxID=7936 RepID=A0A0E9PRE1_ANGAN
MHADGLWQFLKLYIAVKNHFEQNKGWPLVK